jgi:hypothetical protein
VGVLAHRIFRSHLVGEYTHPARNPLANFAPSAQGVWAYNPPVDPNPDETDWSPDPATVTCPECLAEVIEDSQRCPECGHYFSAENARGGRPNWYKIAIAFIVGLLVWRIIVLW